MIAAGLAAAPSLPRPPGPARSRYAETALALAAALTAVLAAGVAVVDPPRHPGALRLLRRRPGRPLGRPHLVRNLVLLAVFGAGLAAVPLAHGRPAPAGAALAAAAGSLAALLIIRWEDLADLFAPIPSLPPAAPAAGRQDRSH